MEEIIEWAITLGVRGWLLFALSMGLSGLIGLLTHRFFQSLTDKTISAQLSEYEQTQKSAAALFLPIASGGIVFGLLLMVLDIVEIVSGSFIVFMIALSYLILPLIKRFRPCTVVLSRGTYFVSNSWIGRDLRDTENDYRIEDKYFMGVTFQVIYVKDKLVGAVYNVDKGFRNRTPQ